MQQIYGFLAALPFWVEGAAQLLNLPFAVCARVARRRGLFLYPALALFGAGLFLAAMRGWDGYAAAYCGYSAFFFALTAPIALTSRKKGDMGSKKSRKERNFDRLFSELESPLSPPAREDPPKVCCFDGAEELFSEGETERNFRLSHAEELLGKLRALPKLSATDRLETDVLSRTLESCRARPLTVSEAETLNDCLASILKLTAKYKL